MTPRRPRRPGVTIALLLAALVAACTPDGGEAPADGSAQSDADDEVAPDDQQEAGDDADDAEDGASEATAERYEQIVDQVAELRDLPVEAEVPMEVVTSEEITEIALADAQDDLEEIARSEAVAKALHHIPEDTDLLELNEQLIEAGVAGIYVPEDERAYVVGGDDEELTPLEQVTVAHEVVHGLQDQLVDLTVLDGFEDDPDGAMAFSSLIEGDATQLQERWAAEHLSEEEQQQRVAEQQQAGAEQLETLGSLPTALLESFVAPYTAGPRFVEALTDGDDLSPVDAALEEPPATMLEVFEPSHYREGFTPEPVEVGAVPEGYARTADWTWGAFEVALMLELTDEQVVDPELITAWRGGRLAGFEPDGDDGRAAVAVGWTFADEAAAGEICEVVADWHASVADGEPTDDPDVLQGPDDALVRSCEGREVRFALGPDVEVARAALGG